MELEDSRREEKPWKPEKINMKHMSNRLRRPQYMEKCVDGGHFLRADLPGGADQHKLSGSDRHGGENSGALDDAGTDSAQRYPDRGKCIPEAGARFGAGVLVPITGFANSVASRRWNTRRKGRYLVSDAKYLQSRVR